MKKIMKKLWVVPMTALLLLSACGSDNNSDGADGSGNDESTVLKVANGADPVTFDIQATNDQATTRISKQIYENLIEQTPDLELNPSLATEWEEVEENLYEFKLREDVTFHNGESFTADDVEFTLRRAVESPTIGHIVDSIDPDTIEVVDDHTIRVGTSDSFGPFITHLSHPAVGILNQKAVEEAGEDYGVTTAVGTGAFQFEEWVTGSKVVTSRYEDYWGDAPELEEIEFLTVADPSVRLIELESDAVDIAYDISPSDLDAVEENDELTLLNTPDLGSEYLGFNLKNDTPLQDKKVRKALAHAVDVESIVDTVYMGVGEQMSGPINELVFGYNDELEPYEYDIEKAKELLEDAGYPDGGFSLSLFVGDNSQERIRVSQIISEALSEVGIDVEVTQMEWGSYLDATAVGEADMFLLGWTTVTTDADYGLYPLFHSDSFGEAGNRTFYANDRVDELLDLGRYTTDQDERLAYYQEAQEIIHDELPWIFLQTRQNVTGINNRVKGFEHHPMGSYDLTTVSLD